MLYLHPDLEKFFSKDQPLFSQLMALRGEIFRDQKGRLTQRLMLGDKTYFIKQHHGVGFKEILKNIFQLKWPVVSAKNEWLAIAALRRLNIPVPVVVGYGEDDKNIANRTSFILMEELTRTISLETFCKNWKESPPDVRFKRKLILEVARMARVMHESGMNHRDFYLCHFLLDEKSSPQLPILFLIDLHRAEIRKKTPRRWIIKDLAGLYFSSKEIGLTSRDYNRFICAYRQKSFREMMRYEKPFWDEVIQRGEKLYRDERN